MRSGHENYQTLYATNDVTTGDFTVNRLGAPNDSTVMVSWIYNLGEKPIIETTNIKIKRRKNHQRMCFLIQNFVIDNSAIFGLKVPKYLRRKKSLTYEEVDN